jgi:hypothetical protein
MTLAHIAGLPVEEGLLALAPVGTAAMACILAQVRAWRRPR